MPKIAPATRTVTVVDPDDPQAKAREFLRLRAQAEQITKAANKFKADLLEYISREGLDEGDGHQWLDLPEEIEGYLALKRERRVSRTVDEDIATEILRAKDMYAECVELVPTINEDAVMGALYQGRLTEDEVDAMFPQKITYALVPSRKSRA